MTAVNLGQRNGRIVSRTEKSSPKGFVYSILLDDGTTTSVVERSNVKRHVNDEYVIQMYGDTSFNTFVRKL